MIRYILVRHVESEGNAKKCFNGISESSLTPFGIKMKEILVDSLCDLNQRYSFDRILASPIERAAIIGREISEKTIIPLEIDDELKEFNFGVFEGMTSGEAEEKFPEFWKEWMADYDGYRLPDGDSGEIYHERIGCFLKRVSQESDDSDEKTILIVAHGGTIHSIMMHLMGLPLSDKWHFNVALGSITIIRSFDGYGILDSMTTPDYSK